MYGWSFAKYPDLTNPLENKAMTYYQEGFTLPVYVVFQLNTDYGLFHAGVGAYYTRVFKGGLKKIDPVWGYLNRNQFGIAWDLGSRYHGFDISVYFRYQLNSIASDSTVPAHLRNFYAGLGLTYFFF